MNRLVIVSNRVADLRSNSQSGGLAVGLADALRARGGIWFGWDGTTSDDLAAPTVDDIGPVRTIAAPLTETDYNEYYVGFANSVLWPLFHYRLDLVDYRTEFHDGYMRVNERLAETLLSELRADDVIWVHDYHLIPFAACLRALGCRQRIGFFLHIPFPPPDLLTATPNHVALVEALLEYDVVGLQTSSDAANLKRYLAEQLGREVGEDGRVDVGGRSVLVGRFPIGIDAAAFAEMARLPSSDVELDTLRQRILGRKQIIGVDRLDYSKGLPERLSAFERLLSRHPELERAVSLLQIAPPTREDVSAYPTIRKELEGMTGSINGRFADINWTPVRYIHRAVPRERLASLFRASQVGLVTPLRDGMNLVAKEYVAAQDPDDPGVLVLSQFAGAAEELEEALIVNPYDADDVADRLYEALTMPLDERSDRHAALHRRILHQDARAWLEGFLARLDEADAAEAVCRPIPRTERLLPRAAER
ncbi:MAG: alpha,alpha-trehalose-phosphate synthase [Rhizobiaceae bacterium]|nr:MAG: alpha,alpha-trehalose-phosphate synthase [Rhizobiaceae bacterium]CAG1014696.1 trehalose 6-phosphate synthase [Rhizobiaceae bacterium]